MWDVHDTKDWSSVERMFVVASDSLDDALATLHTMGVEHPALRWSVEMQAIIEGMHDLREETRALAGQASALAPAHSASHISAPDS